jgi:exodeoxyribonuclease VII large subunit
MAAVRPPEPADVLTVSAVNRLAKQSLESAFPSVWVSAEISQISRAASGHFYLKLKDESACIDATIFRGVLLRLRFDLTEGLEVLARGRLTLYEPNGRFQLNVAEMIPRGIGALELAFQQLKEKLGAKGYFETKRKKPLPRFPKSIALVTSPSGAAVRDMLELLTRRWPVAAVIVVPVRVQGDGSAAEIADAIHSLNRLQLANAIRLDAMIVGRGGGSLEDLWSFNEEIVADAIFASRIPVISAVGHETDFTISDMVADHRALTPSHAVTDLTTDHAELLAFLSERECRMRERIVRRIEIAKQRLDAVAERRVFRAPLDQIRDRERRLDELDARLCRAVGVPLEKAKSQLAALAGRLDSLSPLNVLARGYSLTRTADGRVLQNAAGVRPGDVLTTRLKVGEFTSRVEEIRPPEQLP